MSLTSGRAMPEIRTDQDKASRLISQRLRESAKMSPADANTMAEVIVTALTSSMTRAKKPGLTDWRMVPRLPPKDAVAEIMSALKKYEIGPEWSAERLWHAVWTRGRELPADVVMTDE